MLQQRIRFSLLEEKSISKLFAVATAAVFALVLAGCGGNGGTAQMEEPEEPPMEMACAEGQVGTYPDCMDPPTAEERIAAAQGRAVTAATNARADADAAAMLDHATATDVAAAIAMADAAATAAELARDLANDATDPVVAEALATQAEVSKGFAATALGNAMTASTTAETAAVEAARIAKATKAALTKEMALGVEADVPADDDDGLGGMDVTATDNDAGAYNLAIERDSDATTVTVTVEGATDDDDEEFMLAMDMMDGRTMHTRTQDADADGNVVEEVVIVSTDIEAPTAVAFAKFETADGMTPQALDVRVDGEDATEADPDDALNIDTDNLGMVKADSFKAPAGTVGTTVLSFQHEVADDDGTPADESMDAAEIMGTFNGAMGTYKCNAASAACTATVNTMGVVSAVSTANDWIFIPAMGATSDQPDYDYLHYGFWLKKTTDEDGATTYNEVQTFAGSEAESSTVAAVTGSAEYEGGAVGVYVHKTFKTDGKSDATSGHFKAKANLMATFGQVNDADGDGTLAPNMLNTLTGTIDNFHLSGGETQGWSVTLSGDITAADGDASGDTTGDGSYTATFHGSTDDGDGNNTVAPGSVVGEFDAGFSNGSVAGAFGARKTK